MRLIIEESYPGECRNCSIEELSDKLEKATREARRVVVADSPLAGDGEVKALTAFKEDYGKALDGHFSRLFKSIIDEIEG